MEGRLAGIAGFLLALSLALCPQSHASGSASGQNPPPGEGRENTHARPAVVASHVAGTGGGVSVQTTSIAPTSAVHTRGSKAHAPNVDKIELMLRRQEDLARSVRDLKPSIIKDLAPGGLGVLGVLFGAGLANWSTSRLQERRLENENKASRVMAGIEAASKLMDFKSRQLYELYAPLEALLLQNVTVRGELYRMLLESECADRRYEMRPDPRGQKGQSLFVIPADGSQMLPFRLIEQMAYLKSHHDNVMGPVREIVSVNARIVELLHAKIGLVRSENRKLSRRLGKFLAHQGVLQAVAAPGPEGSIPLPSYTTTFPRRLDKLVKRDADKLREEINDWGKRTSAWMAPLEPHSSGYAS